MISLSNVIKFSTYSSLGEKKVLDRKWDFLEKVKNDQQAHDEDGGDQLGLIESGAFSAAKEETERIIEEARIEAENIKKSAIQELELWKEAELKKIEEMRQQLFAEAQQEGFAAGYQDGLEKGRNEGLSTYEEKIEKAGKIIKRAEIERKERILDSEPYLIDLAIEIAQKIIHREVSQDRSLIVEMVKETLKLSSELKEIAICVHPEDFELVKSRTEELRALVSSQANLIVLPDYSIEWGGCIIRTSLGNLDARIDIQLEEVRKVLMDALKGCDEDQRGISS